MSLLLFICLILLFICLILLTRDWSIRGNNQDFIIGQAIEVIEKQYDGIDIYAKTEIHY